MNATLYARKAYSLSSQSIRTDRDTEYDAFARITSRLKAAASKGPAGFKELAVALYDNRRLWTLLVTDVSNEGNRLSTDLQARIIYLSEFTRVHSTKVLRKEASADALIEINTAVMKGLRQPVPKAQTPQEQ